MLRGLDLDIVLKQGAHVSHPTGIENVDIADVLDRLLISNGASASVTTGIAELDDRLGVLFRGQLDECFDQNIPGNSKTIDRTVGANCVVSHKSTDLTCPRFHGRQDKV